MNERHEVETQPRPNTNLAIAAVVTVVGGTLVVGGQPASAADLVVTTSAASGAGSLAEAVAAANADASADVITFDPGVTGTVDLGSVPLRVSEDLTIVGPGAESLTLTNSAGDVIYVYNTAALTMSGLTISNAASDALAGRDVGDVLITDVVIDGANADGIVFADAVGDVVVERVAVSNTAGDGIAVEDASVVSLQDVIVTGAGDEGIELSEVIDVTITRTSVTESDENGIEVSPLLGPAEITDTTVEFSGYNGIFVEGDSNDGSVTVIERVDIADSDYNGMYLKGPSGFEVRDVTVTRSEDAGISVTDGAAGFVAERVSVTDTSGDGFEIAGVVNDVELSDIDVSSSGQHGAVIGLVGGNVDISDSVVSNSVASGIIVGQVTGAVSLSDTTVHGSTDDGIELTSIALDASIERSTISGGTDAALVLTDVVGGATIVNSTISENDARGDWVVLASATDTTIEHSTIAGNTVAGGSGGSVVYSNNSQIFLDHSIVTDNGGAASITLGGVGGALARFSMLTPGTSLGPDNIETERAMLSTLDDHGGSTSTMHPLAGSPAIDGGDSGIIGEPTTDQRGGRRIAGESIDIGAVEANPGEVSISGAVVEEDAGFAVVTVTRTSSSLVGGSVDVSTTSGSAESGEDFDEVTTTVVWAPGDVSDKTVQIPINVDQRIEGDESFGVGLSNPVGVVIDVSVAEISIIDVVDTAITSVAPQRFADTRSSGVTFDGVNEGTGRLESGEQLEVDVAGRGDVPADAVGVVMNITAVHADDVGYVTAFSCGAERPLASSLNYTADANLGNEVISGLGLDGNVCLYTSSGTDLTVDVVGYITPSSPLTSLLPRRLLDTRTTGSTADGANVGDGATESGSTTVLPIAGRAGIPAGVSEVVVNVTAVNPTDTGYVTVSPCVDPTPTASSLNYVAGVNRGNELVASLDADGALCLYTSSSVDLTVDVVAFLPEGSSIDGVSPARLLDTRAGSATVDGLDAGAGRLDADSEVMLQIAGRGGVAEDATAVVVNVTAVGPDGTGYVTVHPCDDPRPLASSLNFVAGINGGNEIVARLSDGGALCLYTSNSTHLTVDVVASITE